MLRVLVLGRFRKTGAANGVETMDQFHIDLPIPDSNLKSFSHKYNAHLTLKSIRFKRMHDNAR